MSDWVSTTLGQLISTSGGSIKTGPFGTTLKAGEYAQIGAPVVSVGEVGYGSLHINESTPRVPKTVTQRLPEYLLAAGDIVFGRKGAVDRSAWVKHEEAGWFLGSDGIRLRLPDSVNSRFVGYQLRSSETRKWLLQHAAGTTMASLNHRVLERVPLRLPSLHMQHAIAEVLGALDDKIAANTNLVQAADGLSAVIFSSMFQDFERRPLTDVANFVNGKAFTKGASGTGRVVVRIAELNSGIGGSTVFSDIDVPEQHLARHGDVLFAWSGSLTLHRWFRPEAIVNQHIFKVIPSNGYPEWCVYSLVANKLEEFRAIAADKATTMGHIQRRHLEEPAAVPSMTEINFRDTEMTALWERALLAEQESLSLAEIRDALLPELMSGKLRVKDAEKRVEEVL